MFRPISNLAGLIVAEKMSKLRSQGLFKPKRPSLLPTNRATSSAHLSSLNSIEKQIISPEQDFLIHFANLSH